MNPPTIKLLFVIKYRIVNTLRQVNKLL